MAVEEWKMGGDEDGIGMDAPLIGDGEPFSDFTDTGVFEDGQIPADSGQKFQRVKLGLMEEFDGAHRGEGEGQVSYKGGWTGNGFQGRQLLLQNLRIVHRIDKMGLLLEIAVDSLAQTPEILQSLLIGIIIEPGSLRAKTVYKPVVNQAMLSGDFGGGVFGDAAAYCFRFRQHIRHSGTVQLIGTQNACHTAAYNQHIGVYISVLSRKVRLLSVSLP